MKEKCSIVMLPTNEKGALTKRLVDGKLEAGYSNLGNGCWQNQHLYATSDEKIKRGDWCIDKHNQLGQIRYAKVGREKSGLGQIDTSVLQFFFANNTAVTDNIEGHCLKKIIATTDSSLKVNKFNGGALKDLEYSLAAFTSEFIEYYCEVGGIDEGEVEYVDLETDPTQPADFVLNVNRDNTIKIFLPRKDKTRKDVVKFGEKVREYCQKGYANDPTHRVFHDWENWVKENL